MKPTGKCVVLVAPYDNYAQRMIGLFYERYGLRTIAVHNDWRYRQSHEFEAPMLNSPAIAAHFVLPRGGWPELTQTLARRGDIVAVAPHHETTVDPLAQLATDLGLDWAQPGVLPCFRRKASLKALIKRNDPNVRLNVNEIVDSPAAAMEVIQRHGLNRVVLKPDDGAGNERVGFFDATDEAGIRAHIDAEQGPLLLEEFVAGEEFWINGQTDENGDVAVFSIGHYRRTLANGRENVLVAGTFPRTDDPVCGQIADYARRALRATGLRRSPFHMEVLVDDAGPCLIEVGARVGGMQLLVLDDNQHGAPFDALAIAVHHYATSAPYGPYPVNWNRYDAEHAMFVCGVAYQYQQVIKLCGIREVEKLPGFLDWLIKPRVGKPVEPSIDMCSIPYSVAVRADSAAELVELEALVRELIKWDEPLNPPARTLARARLLMLKADRYQHALPRPYQLKAELQAQRQAHQRAR